MIFFRFFLSIFLASNINSWSFILSEIAWSELESRFCPPKKLKRNGDEKSDPDSPFGGSIDEFLNRNMVAGLAHMFKLHHDYLAAVVQEVDVLRPLEVKREEEDVEDKRRVSLSVPFNLLHFPNLSVAGLN